MFGYGKSGTQCSVVLRSAGGVGITSVRVAIVHCSKREAESVELVETN